jgi:DNA mismatch endonuclease (patch repair protein)
MARVKGKNTKPEILVRSMVHRMGYRFRLHNRTLPGNPDLTLPKYNKVIFVHGCFWHGHKGCIRSKRPSTNQEFWNEKLDKNIQRDKRNISKLRKSGWTPLVIWSCEIKKENQLKKKLHRFMEKHL